MSRQHVVVAGLLGIFFLALYLLTGSSDLLHNGDTYLRYQTTQALVDHHRLWLDHPRWLDTRVAQGIGGHLYAFYAPGQTLLMTPLYIIGKSIAHHLSLPYDVATLYACRALDLFLAALLVVVFFFMACCVGYSLRSAGVLSLMFGAATVVWPDAQSALEQTQVNLFLLVAVSGVWSFVKRDFKDRRWLLVAGTGAGLAFFTRYDAAIYLPCVIAYPLTLRWRRGELREALQDLVAFSVSAGPWILAVGLWNYLRFGSAFLTGLHETTFGEPVWSGLAGLLVSPGKGIIWYLPLVFLLPLSLRHFYHRDRALCLFLCSITAVTLLFYANIRYWHGDPAWGPRYLYIVVPYLILPLGELLERWKRLQTGTRLLVAVLVATSLVLNVSAVAVSQWRYWYRLQVAEAHTSQPFRWGAANYHYYWSPRDSPILVQVDNMYQVARLNLGESRYRLTSKPDDPYVSNPADNYPINTLAFWWADQKHPLLGQRTRAGIAVLLAITALAALGMMFLRFYRLQDSTAVFRELELSTANPGRS